MKNLKGNIDLAEDAGFTAGTLRRAEISIDCLVIETTRRCNAGCAHCLRGNCEAHDFDLSVLPKLFRNVASVGSITFSGGEPSLNPGVLRSTLKAVSSRGISVGSVFTVTNALKYSPQLVKYMTEWLSYCSECFQYSSGEFSSSGLASYIEDSGFGLAVSVDPYHPAPDPEAFLRYASLRYYSDCKEHTGDGRMSLISEGRSAENGMGEPLSGRKYRFGADFDSDAGQIEAGEVYITWDGRVLPCCDFSYETADSSEGCFSLKERSLCEILSDSSISYGGHSAAESA